MLGSKTLSMSSRRLVCLSVIVTLAATFALLALAPGSAEAAPKKKVYVVSEMKIEMPYSDYTDFETESFSYNSNGLIKQIEATETRSDMFYRSTTSLKYKSNALKKMVQACTEGSSDRIVVTYKTDKKGRATQEKCAGEKPRAYTYNSKGELSKITWRSEGWDCYIKYTYDSKGRVTKTTYDDPSYSDGIYRFKYDKHGQIVKSWSGSARSKGKGTCYKHTNTYKSGRLVKKVVKEGSYTVEERTFTYKKVSVPKKLVKMVKAQQLAAMNEYIMQIYAPTYLDISAAHK